MANSVTIDAILNSKNVSEFNKFLMVLKTFGISYFVDKESRFYIVNDDLSITQLSKEEKHV